ncbi:MAG: PadR family transcriptional regulator [Candidatus Micrarchaeota archaeon]
MLDQTETRKKNPEKKILRHMFSTFLLWLLSKKELHGYQIMKLLEEDHGYKVISANQLYPMLNFLLKNNLISKVNKQQGKRIRKVYFITKQGLKKLELLKAKMKKSSLRSQFLKEMIA